MSRLFFMTTTICILLTIPDVTTAQCPANCNCLRFPTYQVVCIQAGLTAVPENIPPNTVYLSLLGNSISEIIADDFVGLTKLEDLDLSENIIDTVNETAFHPLMKLRRLYLGSNKLSHFGPVYVEKLNSLIKLDLSNNPDLTQLIQCTLSPLTKLEQLMLHDSPIHYGLHLFGNSSSCSSYQCDAIADDRCHLPVLAELDVSNTSTSEVPVELFLLTPALKTLSLQGNGIKEIPDYAFISLVNLTTLSLNYNNLTSVNKNTFNGTSSLVKLELGNKGLEINPDIFEVMPLLKELSLTLLGQTVIDELAPSLATTSVTTLNLYDNFLVVIPTTITLLTTLNSLDLSQNDISYIPAGGFSSSLSHIDLSYNELTSLHEDAFLGLNAVTFLSLCYNLLERVPIQVFDPLPPSADICLGKNQWDCNCTMAPVVLDIRSHGQYPSPHCASPEALEGDPFSIVTEDSICPPPTTTPPPVPTTTAQPSSSTVGTTPTSPNSPVTSPIVTTPSSGDDEPSTNLETTATVQTTRSESTTVTKRTPKETTVPVSDTSEGTHTESRTTPFLIVEPSNMGMIIGVSCVAALMVCIVVLLVAILLKKTKRPVTQDLSLGLASRGSFPGADNIGLNTIEPFAGEEPPPYTPAPVPYYLTILPPEKGATAAPLPDTGEDDSGYLTPSADSANGPNSTIVSNRPIGSQTGEVPIEHIYLDPVSSRDSIPANAAPAMPGAVHTYHVPPEDVVS